jgi:hypothetical protein
MLPDDITYVHCVVAETSLIDHSHVACDNHFNIEANVVE